MAKAKVKTVRKSKGLTGALPRTSTRGTRLARRSPEEIDKLIIRIVKIVSKAKDRGMTSEQILMNLGIDKRELPRPLRVACNTGRLQWDGRCRATRYYAV